MKRYSLLFGFIIAAFCCNLPAQEKPVCNPMRRSSAFSRAAPAKLSSCT